MNEKLLTLGFSPCPNDTYMLAALINGWIDTSPYRFEFVIEDIADLNKMAFQSQLDISKISFYTYTQVVDHYRLLDAGSALGMGCGPLLIAKDPKWLEKPIQEASVAIPGFNTTANMLLSLAYPEVSHKKEYLFSDIEQAVQNEEVDLGLIIHENRFTYEANGLYKINDLGDYWEQTTGTAIPLGGFVIRNEQSKKIQQDIEAMLRESILFADKNYDIVKPYIKSLSQELDDAVIKQHIKLYVNTYSKSLGSAGRKSIDTLFDKLEKNKIAQQKK